VTGSWFEWKSGRAGVIPARLFTGISVPIRDFIFREDRDVEISRESLRANTTIPGSDEPGIAVLAGDIQL